jgi:hypothetical protein
MVSPGAVQANSIEQSDFMHCSRQLMHPSRGKTSHSQENSRTNFTPVPNRLHDGLVHGSARKVTTAVASSPKIERSENGDGQNGDAEVQFPHATCCWVRFHDRRINGRQLRVLIEK